MSWYRVCRRLFFLGFTAGRAWAHVSQGPAPARTWLSMWKCLGVSEPPR